MSTIQSGSLPLIDRGRFTSAAFTASGLPYVAYQSWWGSGNESVRVAYRDFMGSGNCGVGAAAGFWQCDDIVSAPGIGAGTDIVIDPLGRAQIAFYDPIAGHPHHAIDVGSGGNCGPSNSWRCRTAHVSGSDYGRSISLFAAADGTPHMAFMDDSAHDLVYARFVGAAGNCGPQNPMYTWVCTTLDDGGMFWDEAAVVSIAGNTAGATVAYHEEYTTLGEGNLKAQVCFTPLFANGFESGNVGAWTSTVP